MLLTIDQAKKYLRLPNTVSAENFNPFIPDATRKYLQPYMGGDLLAKLDSYSGGSLNVTENAAKWDTLLDLTRSALSRFTFFLATPSLDLNITESGILVGNTQSMAPASKERVGSFKDSLEDLGFNALDAVLKHLDENKTVFTDWTASDAYKTFSSGFIRSVDDF
ncbi:MAG TPA: DUF6712 family protein, partial [Williamwhitmania sp.]|nr:DUF6712 family protein [Williamwhitmania sp.]